jgi:tudor domain-containing protein 1/4/6/7
VITCHVASLGQFWIQVATPENVEQLTQLMDDLDKYAAANHVEKFQRCPRKGEMCLAKFSEDQMWYRACVIDVVQSSCSVQFVDFGNTETVPPSSVGHIPRQFLSLPVQALCCTLAGVTLQDYTSPSPGATDSLKQMVDGKCLLCEVVSSYPLCVQLSELNNPSGLSVRDKLSKMQLMTFVDDSALLRIERAELRESDRSTVIVSHSAGPGDIYVQLVNKTSVESFAHLSAQINAYCSQAPTCNPSQVCFGQVVCARFSEDQTWYRAKVMSVVDSSSVRVQFVDCGNTDIVSVSSLVKMLPDFVHLPAQAVRCCLKGFENFGEENSISLQSKFQELVQGKSLTLAMCGHVCGDGGTFKYTVDLIDTSSPVDVRLSSVLH